MFKYLNSKVKELDMWDIALTKWAVFFITIAIVKVFPGLLKLDFSLLILIGLLLAAKPTYKVLKK